MFRSVPFLNVVPGSQARSDWNIFDASAGWPHVVTLLFIGTSLNVVKPFQQVYSPLEPGGILINLGPLFWTPPEVTLELTSDVSFSAIELVGRTRVWVDKMKKYEYTRD